MVVVNIQRGAGEPLNAVGQAKFIRQVIFFCHYTDGR